MAQLQRVLGVGVLENRPCGGRKPLQFSDSLIT